MPRTISLLLVLAVLAGGTAHAQIAVFHADFDQDTPGAPPALDPPGAPDGDYLQIYTSGGTVQVESAYGGLDSRPLVINRSTTASVGVQFWVDPDLRDCAAYDIHLRCVLDNYVGYVYLPYSSPNFQTMGALEFRPDGVMTLNGDTNVLVSTYAPMTPMEIDIHLDIVAKTTDVTIDGVPDPQGQGIGHLQTAGDGLRFFSVAYGMIDPSVLGIDDVHIVGSGCPGVGNERRSWGSLKALYR